ncbi:hypothetical protein KIY80_gp81 [Mycobacterium phage Benvolio]|uniref:Uncharacterized protein n=1 Tax=Mycobacterium phage Benvolio TaxID=2591074 RepID=A0A514A3P5_9CAUD|nr:hypothetical protein CH13_gp084 [Mycobacterium phage Echild]YP_010063518.1 hypothetical protein KIY80_gp81 [Mycobacterium phage Benvolio]AHG24305.1 hypothetical protein PBI_ECHILD_84 [Mycobacterium phage Echild]QDH47897.1 hypothetical protein SEA_BENVOLIO_81 [Mycobacterium phage Benvolio]
MIFEAKCPRCPWKCAAAKRRLFGIAVRQHEIHTGHRVNIKEA